MANVTAVAGEGEKSTNKAVVEALYDALTAGDAIKVSNLVASDLEWWFHGPPSHQFLMRLLTATSSDGQDSSNSNKSSFYFNPQSIVSLGCSLVIAEGCDHSRSISWVHAWTVSDGIITQVREYFNTSVTVTRLGSKNQSQSSDQNNQTSSSNPRHFQPLWESSLSNRAGKSVPGLVLAI